MSSGVRKVIIPVGGEALRLRPLTLETSKAMIRLLNRPLVEFSIVHLAMQGVEEFYLGVRGYVNYRSIYDYFGEGFWLSLRYGIPHRVRIRYQPNVDSVGNADSVRIIMEYYDIKEPVLVIQGDNLFQLDLHNFYKWHVEKDSFMTIALKEHDRLEEFGVADVNEDLRITRFVEKPKSPREAPSNLVNSGLYLLSSGFREFFEGEVGRKLVLEGRMDFGKDVIPTLIEHGYPVYGYRLRGYWFDVGTPGRYLEAMRYLLLNASLEELEARKLANGLYAQGTSKESRMLHEEIREKVNSGLIKVEGVVLIGRHVKIGNGTYLANSTVDNYTIIEDNAHIEGSAVMDRCYIGRGARIVNSIIGRHVQVGEGAVIIDSVVADNARIGRGTMLVNVKVSPHRSVGSNTRIENYEL